MAQIAIDKKKIENIATAIRNKGGSDEPMLPGDMSTRISDLQVGDVAMHYWVQEKPRDRGPGTSPQSIFIESNIDSDLEMISLGAHTVSNSIKTGYGMTAEEYPLPESDGYYHWRMQVNDDGEYDFCFPTPICLPPDYTSRGGSGLFSDTGPNASQLWQARDGIGVPVVVDWETVELVEDSTVKPIGFVSAWAQSGTVTSIGGRFYRFNYTFVHPEHFKMDELQTYNTTICTKGAANTYIVIGKSPVPKDGILVSGSTGQLFRPEGVYTGVISRYGYPVIDESGSAFSALVSMTGISTKFIMLVPYTSYTSSTPAVGYIWCGDNITTDEVRQKLIDDDYRIFVDLASGAVDNLVQPQSSRDAAKAIKLRKGLNEFHVPTATVYTVDVLNPANGPDWGFVCNYQKEGRYSDYTGAGGATWYDEDDWEQENPHECVILYKAGQRNPSGIYRESRW